MDMKNGLNRTDHLHVCHVDLDELDNGMASIVEVSTIHNKRVSMAYIDTQGYFRGLSNDNPFHRDMMEIK